MLLKDCRLLSFACFGTLIDRDAGLASALKPLAMRSGANPRREDLLAAFDRHEAEALESQRHATYLDVLAEAHLQLSRELGASNSADDHRLFALSINHWPAFPDAAGSLQYLKRYFRLAVVSNGDRDTLRVVSRRLEVGFDVVCSAHEAGAFKPDQRPFNLLLDRAGKLGITPGRSLHLAANLPHDLLPAGSSGLACAWLRRDGSRATVLGNGHGAPQEPFQYVFRSLAHLVSEHQEQLRA